MLLLSACIHNYHIERPVIEGLSRVKVRFGRCRQKSLVRTVGVLEACIHSPARSLPLGGCIAAS